MKQESTAKETTAQGLFRRGPRFLAGGMDPNDFLKVIDKVNTWDDWVNGIQKYADERKNLGEQALANERYISAGEYFIESGIYYHFAVLGYFEDMDRKYALKKKSVETYALGFDYIIPPIRRIDIPYDDINMAAHLRIPQNNGNGPFPVVFLLPGVDSTKEEYFLFSEVLVKRGLATLAFEGLGQGETRQFRAMTADYEIAFSTALDFIQDIKEIDITSIAVYGRSMGGHLAPRVAAHDSRIKAVVSAGGIYEMTYWDGLSPITKDNFRHAWGYENVDDAREHAMNMTLDGIIPKISCPFLIVHSKNDKNFPAAGAIRMKDEAKCETELLIYEEGSHVADNIRYKYQRDVADWLCKQFKIIT
jgi:2,6-dihydroxypseudooxynicotine hydrolase